jgi:hypothetical protein
LDTIVAVVEVKHQPSSVPPITHKGYTDTHRKKLIDLERIKNTDKDADLDELVDTFLKGKKHNRGYRAMSKQSQDRVRHYERMGIAAATKEAEGDREVEGVCWIIGMAQDGEHENLVCVHWQGYPGHQDEFQWIPASQVDDMASIDERLDSEGVVVSWVNKLGHTATEVEYQGVLQDVDEHDLIEAAAAEKLGAQTSMNRVFKVAYREDCSAELLNLETLQVVGATCDECKAYTKAQHKRSMWVLANHWNSTLKAALRERFLGKTGPPHVAPATKAGKRKQPSMLRESNKPTGTSMRVTRGTSNK